jgi:uncharacterized coiled-coil DUF342 family protein
VSWWQQTMAMFRNITMTQATVSIALCTAALLMANKNLRESTTKKLKVLWDGDFEREELLDQFKEVHACILKWKNKISSIESKITTLSSAITTQEATAKKKEEKKESSSKEASVSSYYHFDSKGNKFKNKWDSYDVDAEIEALDKEEETATVDVPLLKSQEKKELIAAHSELWGAQELVDSILVGTDDELKATRKQCVNKLAELMTNLDKLKTKFNIEEKR